MAPQKERKTDYLPGPVYAFLYISFVNCIETDFSEKKNVSILMANIMNTNS